MISVISSHVVYYPYIEYHEPQISYHCFTYLTHLCLLCFTCWPTKTPKPLTSSAYFTSSLYVTPIYWPTWPLASMFHLFTHLTSGHYMLHLLTHLNSGLYVTVHLLTHLTLWLYVTPIDPPDLWPLTSLLHLFTHRTSGHYILHLLTHLTSGLYVTPVDPPELWPLCYTYWPTWPLHYVTTTDLPELWPLCYTYWPTWPLASMLHLFTHLNSGLREANLHSQILSSKHVRIVGLKIRSTIILLKSDYT